MHVCVLERVFFLILGLFYKKSYIWFIITRQQQQLTEVSDQQTKGKDK